MFQNRWNGLIHLKTSRLFLQSLDLFPQTPNHNMSQYHQEPKLLYCSLKAVSRPSKDDLVVWRPFAAFMRILPSYSRTIRLKPNRTRSCVLVCKLANGCQWKVYVYLGLGLFFQFYSNCSILWLLKDSANSRFDRMWPFSWHLKFSLSTTPRAMIPNRLHPPRWAWANLNSLMSLRCVDMASGPEMKPKFGSCT